MKNLTKSIEERAINLIISGVDAIEAVKQAIIEENKLINELLEQRTERSQNAKAKLCKNTYHLIHLMS